MLGVGDLKIFCFELTHDEYWAIATRFEKYTLGRLRNTFYKVDPLWYWAITTRFTHLDHDSTGMQSACNLI